MTILVAVLSLGEPEHVLEKLYSVDDGEQRTPHL